MNKPNLTLVKENHPEIERILTRNEIFATLPAVKFRQLAASAATLQKISRGSPVLVPKGCLGVVGFGLIKTEHPSFIVGLVGPSEIVELLDDESGAKHSVLTDTATLVFVRRKDLFFEIPAPTSLAVAFNLHKALGHMTRRLRATFNVRAEARLAQVLLDLLDRFGDEREDGTAFISLRMTRAELASLAGMTPETASRALGAWRKAGLVTTDGDGFQIRSQDELRKVVAA